MNLFHFLKSTKGAIKPLNALLISGAAGALFAYTVHTGTHKQIQAQRGIRSLSSIESASPHQGLHRRGDSLTSINVHDSLNQVATAEERAAMQGQDALARYEANQRALGNMDTMLGRAAELAEGEEGLNTGNRNAVHAPTRFVVGNPNVNAGDGTTGASYVPGDSQGGATAGSDGSTATPQLTKAPMARASGNAFGGTSGGAAGTVSGGTSGLGGREAPTTQEPGLSGAMPGGSNIVSQRAKMMGTNPNTASFSKERDARVNRPRLSRKGKNELDDIVKRTADAARNIKDDAANEGGRPFLASATNSGGVSVTGEGENPPETTNSADLAPTNHRLKAIGNKLKAIEDEQEQRKKEQKSLMIQMITTIVGSIGLMALGAIVLKNWDATIKEYKGYAAAAPTEYIRNIWRGIIKAYTIVRWVTAAALMATVAGFNGWLMANAIKFLNKYQSSGGTGIARVAVILAPIMVAGMVFTAIKPEGWNSLKNNIKDHLKNAFDPVGMATNSLTGSITKLMNKK